MSPFDERRRVDTVTVKNKNKQKQINPIPIALSFSRDGVNLSWYLVLP